MSPAASISITNAVPHSVELALDDGAAGVGVTRGDIGTSYPGVAIRGPSPGVQRGRRGMVEGIAGSGRTEQSRRFREFALGNALLTELSCCANRQRRSTHVPRHRRRPWAIHWRPDGLVGTMPDPTNAPRATPSIARPREPIP